MKHTLITLLALGLVAVSSTAAQNPGQPPRVMAPPPAGNGEVQGTVLDAPSNTPIPRATIAVRSKKDSTLVAGAIATSDGRFRIQGLRQGTYYLRITSIGYGPRIQEFTIADAAPAVDVGNITLSHVAIALQEVEVTGQRSQVTIEPDRNAYRAKEVAPTATNASEVLDAVPSVQVDGDGKVSLRGNENVAIQINGRPSPITGAQLAGYLKGIPANIVERIEVIPNPSAKYDPEGMAGIINIVLKANTDLGVSGGLNASAANTGRYNSSGNLGYQHGALTTFSNLGFNSDDRGIFGINDRERYDAQSSLLSVTDQDLLERNRNVGVNFGTTVDYKLTPRDVLSNAITINRRASADDQASAYTELSSSRAMVDSYDRLRGTKTTGLMLDYDVSLKRTFEPRKHELSSELRFNRAHDTDNTDFWKVPNGSTSRNELENDHSDGVTKTFTGQVDYTRTLKARTKLETGYKGNARWLDRDFIVMKDPLGDGNWALSNLSNAFQFDENVEAAYAVLSQGLGKFDLQGGLRGEYASRNFSLSSTNYPYHYTSLFPSGVLLYNLSDATQMKASYSRRIRRPGSQELNPFPQFFDIQNVFIGNPNLSPEYTDAIELGLTRTGALGSLQLSPFYRRTTDVIRVDINTADTVDGREVTSVSFKNLATSTSWGSDLNASLKLGPRFNGFGSFNVFKVVTDGGSSSVVGSDAVSWSARLNGTTQLNPTLTLQASYFYRAPMKIEKGKFSGVQFTSISFKQKVHGDAAAVTLRFSDPFNTNAFRIRAGDDNVTQITARNFGVRSTWIGFQYNFGQTPKIRQVRPEDTPSAPAFP
ncbi:MAG: TonB-dependent receptor domain-containing protein [Gemmatimonadaceae bacterium]